MVCFFEQKSTRGLNLATLNYDPKIPVYAAPKTSFTNVAAQQSADPTQIVDKATGTVAGQLNGLLSSGSQYLDAAQSKAMRTSNARGLLNSGVAAGEGAYAAINAATPIATSDANIYANLTAQNNQTANTAILNNQTAALDYGKSLTNAELNGALASQALAGTFEGKKMDSAAQMGLAEVNNAANLDLAKTNNAANLDLAGVNNASALERDTLKNAASLQEAELGARTTLTGKEMDVASAARNADLEASTRLELQKMTGAADLTRAELDAATRISLQDKESASQVKLQSMADQGRIDLQTLSDNNKLTLQNVSDVAQMMQIKVKGAIDVDLQNSSISAEAKNNVMGAISNMGEQALVGISNVMLNKDLNAEAKQSAVDAIINSYTANATTAGAIAGINLSWGEGATASSPTVATAESSSSGRRATNSGILRKPND